MGFARGRHGLGAFVSSRCVFYAASHCVFDHACEHRCEHCVDDESLVVPALGCGVVHTGSADPVCEAHWEGFLGGQPTLIAFDPVEDLFAGPCFFFADDRSCASCVDVADLACQLLAEFGGVLDVGCLAAHASADLVQVQV